jgi:16S rRNA (cytosine1402-N4)-methyltransferase
MSNSFNHITVLKKETIDRILPSSNLLTELNNNNEQDLFFLDVTLGGGGHAHYLVDAFFSNPNFSKFNLNLVAFDRDQEAISYATTILNSKKEIYNRFNFKIFHSNFMNAHEFIADHFKGKKFHGIYADLGVSSPQLDHTERGFSFLQEGPVDMRMDKTQELTAKDILLNYSEKELIKIFFDYGEEPRSKKLAQCIVMDRKKNLLPTENNKQLAEYIKRVLAYPSNSKTHPATRTFQALRIEVNNELKSIETFLQNVPNYVHHFGKVALISFHSLEDRIVKHAMRNWQKGKMANENTNEQNDSNLPLHIQLCLYDNKKRSFGFENPRGGITPSDSEIKANARSRSARLRCFEFNQKIEDSDV